MKLDITKKSNEFKYQLLDRLVSDCDYYLNQGNCCTSQLWAKDEHQQIEDIKTIWNSLTIKPEWLTFEQVKKYEKEMLK